MAASEAAFDRSSTPDLLTELTPEKVFIIGDRWVGNTDTRHHCIVPIPSQRPLDASLLARLQNKEVSILAAFLPGGGLFLRGARPWNRPHRDADDAPDRFRAVIGVFRGVVYDRIIRRLVPIDRGIIPKADVLLRIPIAFELG